MLPPDARRGGKRQLNIPLNLLFYCRNVLWQPLLPHQAERREGRLGQKGGVRVVRGSIFPLKSKHSWQDATKVEAGGAWLTDTESLFGKNVSPASSWILKRLLCFPAKKQFPVFFSTEAQDLPGDGLILNGTEKIFIPITSERGAGKVKHRWNIKAGEFIFRKSRSVNLGDWEAGI